MCVHATKLGFAKCVGKQCFIIYACDYVEVFFSNPSANERLMYGMFGQHFASDMRDSDKRDEDIESRTLEVRLRCFGMFCRCIILSSRCALIVL